MAIPPFPSHDLAKLVLGYLAEEQLMTAYDEFLQASPYLDVLRNEYDRIFMTSLRSILSEYRAVKIYVETCKPFLLRKKIFQCSNLLEVVKFLVNHVDVNRLQTTETTNEKLSHNKETSHTRSNVCILCNSIGIGTCECRTKVRPVPTPQHTSQNVSNNADTSIETTSLADLPGNSITKRNSNKELATEMARVQCNLIQQISQIHTMSSSGSVEQIQHTSSHPSMYQRSSQIPPKAMVQQVSYMTFKNQNTPSSVSVSPHESSIPFTLESNHAMNKEDISTVKSNGSKPKIDEFNTIYKLVCSNNSSSDPIRRNFVPQESVNKPICNAGSFQEFETNVAGNGDMENPIVPDSSTSECCNTRTSKETKKKLTPITNIKGLPVGHMLMKTGTINQNITNMPKSNSFVKIKDKPDDPKITILSDVKVDNRLGSNYVRVPQVLRSSTCNSMVQMQSILINGTPAFTSKRQSGNFTYTKDEIMAMPTIIVVPSSGLTQSSSAVYTQSTDSQSTNSITKTTNATPHRLSPLVIDVTNSPTPEKGSQMPELNSTDPKQVVSEGLVKTVDVTAASLPKDANIAVPKTSTPNVIPPTRKSSSTPRRNSHIRVLDFATPRRILHETINEHDPNPVSTESCTNDTEIVLKGSVDIPILTNILTHDKYNISDFSNKSKNTSTKENKSKPSKKSNWDAELRALVLGKEICEEPLLPPKPKLKKTKKKKKASTIIIEQLPETADADEKSPTTFITLPTATKSNENIKLSENVVTINEGTTTNSEVKTINNIIECEGSGSDLHVTDTSQVKINTSEDRVDTPEAEKLCLQNVIGAKLNISDLLETPYKQALYDIQMETPKFFSSGLPDEPISDIKIMNIPTPRFLNTPKPLQATPSYASRPTDYSSGSSYYKPDDHDYIPPPDVLQCVDALNKNTIKSKTNDADSKQCKEKEKTKEKEKPSRPQRKCTRNVSYRSPTVCKSKNDESFEVASVSSELSNKSTKSNKVNKSMETKAHLKSKIKSVSKKKIVVYKSPLKPTNFMKMKPRRAPLVKDTSNKGRKKTHDIAENGASKTKKKSLIKDRNTNDNHTLATAPAKSRRKSSTPRKLNCTKVFSSEPVVQNSCIMPNSEQENVVKETKAPHIQDSDNEQLALRWSDDGSQDAKPKDKEEQPTSSSLLEDDDIIKIREYIETSAQPKHTHNKNSEGSLQIDLIKRGFDAETAKIIERDLLDATPIQDTAIQSTSNEELSVKNIEISVTENERLSSDSVTANIAQEEDEIQDIELSVNECNEDSNNFILCQFDESRFIPSDNIPKLKDKFTMELCIDDDLTIRLRANPFTSLFDMDPQEMHSIYNHRETEDAVSSISNIHKLYTPIKDVRKQCYEIFDSTLTSIDTPLKSDETNYETKVTEIVLEVESIKEDVKEKTDNKKRKRLQSGNLEDSMSKKSKPNTQYLLNSANIQNIDIESVLSKLHGP